MCASVRIRATVTRIVVRGGDIAIGTSFASQFNAKRRFDRESFAMKSKLLAIALLWLVASGCVADPKSSQGFSLPDGDAERGKATFAKLQCHACHTVSGVEFDKLDNTTEPIVALGGVTPQVRTYGDLVTSIINPSHRFALGYPEDEVTTDRESKMRLYNDEMTIAQLIDLVAFLQSHYQVEAYQPTPYMPYY